MEKQKEAHLRGAQGIVEESLISLRDEGTATAGAILSDTAREMEEQKKAHLRGTQAAVEKSLISLKDEATATAGAILSDAAREMEEQKQAHLREMKSDERRNDDEIYKQTKERFKEELIQFYEKKKRYIQVSPLNPKRKQKLADVFVSQRLCHDTSNQENQPLQSYREMFFNGDTKLHNVFIKGEAGSGKSTLCQHLTLSWCNSHTLTYQEGTGEDMRQFNDTDTLRQFGILFAVILRSADASDRDMETLIRKQVLKQLPHKADYTDEFLSRVLNEEECLIVTDGLDEWQHKLPYTIYRPNCTYVTTTRPWKMSQIEVEDPDTDIKFVVEGIDNPDLLIENMFSELATLETEHDHAARIKQFNDEIERSNLKHIVRLPLVLMQLICVWLQNQSFGNSRCEIYASAMKMLIKRTYHSKNVPMHKSNSEQSVTLPHCFTREATPTCIEFFVFVQRLAALAFSTLLSKDQTASIVFEKSIIDGHLSDEDCSLALEIGILSQYEEESFIEGKSTYSFLHKTFQEFLCAVHIASKPLELQACVDEILDIYKPWDIMELFVFVCGLAPGAGVLLSNNMATCVSQEVASGLLYDRKSRSYMEMIIRGYQESIQNGHPGPGLTLQHVNIGDPFMSLSPEDSDYLDNLLDMPSNAGNLLTLFAKNISYEKVQKEVDRNPGLTGIGLTLSDGVVIDLSKCNHLEHLHLFGGPGGILFPARIGSTLLSCHLMDVPEYTACNLLRLLEVEESRLRELEIARLLEPEIARLREPDIAQLRELKRARLRELKEARLLEPAIARLREPEIARLRELEIARLREPEIARLREPEIARLREPEIARLLELEIARLLELEIALLRELEIARLREPDIARLREPDIAQLREPEIARLWELKRARLRELKRARLRELKRARLPELESALLRELEIARLRELESADCDVAECLLQVLPSLTNLQQITLECINIGDRDIPLKVKVKVRKVKLFLVVMSARSLERLMAMLKGMPQSVECDFDWGDESMYDQCVKYLHQNDLEQCITSKGHLRRYKVSFNI